MEEKRKHERNPCFGIVYAKNKEDSEAIGYVIDISKTGAGLLINSTRKKVRDTFSIILFPPPIDYDHLEPLDVDVEIAWEKKSEKRDYILVGCQFINLSDSQNNRLQKMIEAFIEAS